MSENFDRAELAGIINSELLLKNLNEMDTQQSFCCDLSHVSFHHILVIQIAFFFFNTANLRQ